MYHSHLSTNLKSSYSCFANDFDKNSYIVFLKTVTYKQNKQDEIERVHRRLVILRTFFFKSIGGVCKCVVGWFG